MPTKTGTALKKAPKSKEKKVKAPAKGDSNSFAVIATGGKQYVVSSGTSIRIEKMKGDYKEGDTLTFDQVLLLNVEGETKIGEPTVSQAKVTGTLVKIGRAPKVVVIKYKQKSRYFKKNGHRQPYFEVKIDSIK